MTLPGDTFVTPTRESVPSHEPELPPRPLHHHVSSTSRNPRGWPVGRMPVTTARDLVPCTDQRELAVGDQTLADQHPVELGANSHHVFGGGQALVGFGGGGSTRANSWSGSRRVVAMPKMKRMNIKNASKYAVDMSLASAAATATEPNFLP